MDERIGRLVATFGADRTATATAASVVARILHEERRVFDARARVLPLAASNVGVPRVLFNSSSRWTGTCAASGNAGAIFRRPLYV